MAETSPNASDDFDDPLNDFEPTEYSSELHRALAEDTVAAIQSSPFIQVTSESSIHDAHQALEELSASSLLVVEGEKLVGIFTERDFLEKVADRISQLSQEPVRDVMTSNPSVVYESDPVGTAVAAIAVEGHRHVPVLKLDGSVMGIVSPKRILRFLEERMASSAQGENG